MCVSDVYGVSFGKCVFIFNIILITNELKAD